MAGLGFAGVRGWGLEERNDLVEPVSRVLAIYRGESPAAYVPLPVKVK